MELQKIILGYSGHGDHPAEWFWRVESIVTHSRDRMGREIAEASVHFNRWFIVGATEKMVKLSSHRDWPGLKPIYVLKDPHGKRFAYPTRKLAWESWKRRQEWRLRHAERALRAAEATNDLAAQMDDGRASRVLPFND